VKWIAAFLILFSLPARGDELLDKAVAKLIIDVHNLKLKVAELETRLNECGCGKKSFKTSQSNATKSNKKQLVTVLRGRFKESNRSCLIATVSRLTPKGEQEVTSLLPKEVPVFVRPFKGKFVYLTFPEYCGKVKEKFKDAEVTRIRIK